MGFRKVALILLICAGMVPALQAQNAGRHNISLSWGMAATVGDNNVVNKATLIAPSLEYGYFISNKFSLGFSVGFAYNDEKGETSDWVDQGGYALVTGNSERSLTLIPLQVQGRWFPLNNGGGRILPFVTLSAGAQYGTFNITGHSINTYKGSRFGFVVTPDIGVRFFLSESRKTNLDIRVGYQYATNSWENINHNKSLQRIGGQLSFGMSF